MIFAVCINLSGKLVRYPQRDSFLVLLLWSGHRAKIIEKNLCARLEPVRQDNQFYLVRQDNVKCSLYR